MQPVSRFGQLYAWAQRKYRCDVPTINPAPVHSVPATKTILEGAARIPSVLVCDRRPFTGPPNVGRFWCNYATRPFSPGNAGDSGRSNHHSGEKVRRATPARPANLRHPSAQNSGVARIAPGPCIACRWSRWTNNAGRPDSVFAARSKGPRHQPSGVADPGRLARHRSAY